MKTHRKIPGWVWDAVRDYDVQYAAQQVLNKIQDLKQSTQADRTKLCYTLPPGEEAMLTNRVVAVTEEIQALEESISDMKYIFRQVLPDVMLGRKFVKPFIGADYGSCCVCGANYVPKASTDTGLCSSCSYDKLPDEPSFCVSNECDYTRACPEIPAGSCRVDGHINRKLTAY